MPATPERTNFPAWLTYHIMSTFEQTLHRQGSDPQYVPYAWKALQAVEERVTQQAHALTQDFDALVTELEASRKQAGLKKMFL